MSKYSRDQLVEMAYLYLVEGMIQRDIESEMGLPPSTVSQELRPFGITGRKNNTGRGGWGAKGNHCGIASPARMGFQVTRKHVYDFMFGSGKGMSDDDYFRRLKQEYDNSNTDNDNSYEPSYNSSPSYEGNGYSGTGGTGIGGAIAFIVVVAIIAVLLGKIGIFSGLGKILLLAVKVIVALAEGSIALLYVRGALEYRKWITLAFIVLFSIWGFAVMFFGDGLLWGAGIWGIGLLIGWIRVR